MRSSSSGCETSTVSSLHDEYLRRAAELLVQAAWTGSASNSFADFESRLYAAANEAVRRRLQAQLQEIADGHAAELRVDDIAYRQHEPGQVEYHTLVGKVEVRRWTYRRVGVRNSATIVPLELSTGIVHRATPALAYSVALGYAAGPMRHYEQQLKAAHRAPPPRATLERLATRIGGCAAQDTVKIEAQLRPSETMAKGAQAIAVSLDRTSVAMAEERPPNAPPNSRRRPRTEPYQRRKPHPIDVNWRMIYVGTVSLVDACGEVITTRKYHATPEEGAEEITPRMMADVVHWRSQRPLPVVVVQDGAAEMWNEIRDALRRVGVQRLTEVLDRFHADEHLAAALELIEPDQAQRRLRLEQWRQSLDESDGAANRICRWLDAQWRALSPGSRKWKDLGGHVTYLMNHGPQMKYSRFRRLALPIASGPVEGACKSLVACRAKRSGQRWKQDGLTAVLTLRALELSERFRPFWEIFEQRFCAQIAAA